MESLLGKRHGEGDDRAAVVGQRYLVYTFRHVDGVGKLILVSRLDQLQIAVRVLQLLAQRGRFGAQIAGIAQHPGELIADIHDILAAALHALGRDDIQAILMLALCMLTCSALAEATVLTAMPIRLPA